MAAAGALKLLAITAELHVFAGVTNWEQPLRLGIALDGRAFVRICEQRGDSIRFDDRPLEPADLGEGGRVEVHDVTERLGPHLRGAEVDSVRAIEEAEGSTVGLALIRGDGSAFCIWVSDDEFHWGDSVALEAAARATGRRHRIGAAL